MKPTISVTPRQMQRLDALAQEKAGIPSLLLMENAGRCVADAACRMLAALRGKRVVCVCGKGNNAGDGFVAARHLTNRGFDVRVFLAVDPALLKGDARTNACILKRMGVVLQPLQGEGDRKRWRVLLRNSSLVIDALFGIGFKGRLGEPFRSIIFQINDAQKSVLAVDVPSGLDALTGAPASPCIKAAQTVTFAFAKRGLIKKRASGFVGKLTVADISIPGFLLKRIR